MERNSYASRKTDNKGNYINMKKLVVVILILISSIYHQNVHAENNQSSEVMDRIRDLQEQITRQQQEIEDLKQGHSLHNTELSPVENKSEIG